MYPPCCCKYVGGGGGYPDCPWAIIIGTVQDKFTSRSIFSHIIPITQTCRAITGAQS